MEYAAEYLDHGVQVGFGIRYHRDDRIHVVSVYCVVQAAAMLYGLLELYSLPDCAHFCCRSSIVPTFSVGHLVSVKLYCRIINQDSTLVVYSNARCFSLLIL